MKFKITMVQTRAQTFRKNTKKTINPNIYKNTKPKQPKQKKIVKFEEDFSNITHIYENNRIITIAFFYHPINKTLRYGATIFQNEKGFTWNKKDHVKTARNRFGKSSVKLVNFSPFSGHFREFLRKQLFKFGVCDTSQKIS